MRLFGKQVPRIPGSKQHSAPAYCLQWCRRPFLRPGLHVVRGIARRDSQSWPSQLFYSCSASAGHALTIPSTVPRSRRQRLCRRRLGPGPWPS